jgi:hypothetical protein
MIESKKRYGKPSDTLIKQKKDFFENSDKYLERQQVFTLLYKKQPKRKECKNCLFRLATFDFIKDGIGYALCNRCNHLNGIYEDSDDFCHAVYTKNSGSEYYAQDYFSKNLNEYNFCVETVYRPKAEFLLTSLREQNINLNDLSFADIGAGSGYFIAALKSFGLEKVSGYEVSETQVKLANNIIGENIIKQHVLEDIDDIVKTVEAEIVSMIGVLEHLQSPRQVLRALKNNKNVKYLFVSVPLFSLSVYFETSFPHIYHRQLSGGHTHLYTEESLRYMCKEFDLVSIAEWWFGTDIVDLYRSVYVNLVKMKSSGKIINNWQKTFLPLIDSVQLEVDKKHLSDEVHMVLKKV